MTALPANDDSGFMRTLLQRIVGNPISPGQAPAQGLPPSTQPANQTINPAPGLTQQAIAGPNSNYQPVAQSPMQGIINDIPTAVPVNPVPTQYPSYAANQAPAQNASLLQQAMTGGNPIMGKALADPKLARTLTATAMDPNASPQDKASALSLMKLIPTTAGLANQLQIQDARNQALMTRDAANFQNKSIMQQARLTATANMSQAQIDAAAARRNLTVAAGAAKSQAQIDAEKTGANTRQANTLAERQAADTQRATQAQQKQTQKTFDTAKAKDEWATRQEAETQASYDNLHRSYMPHANEGDSSQVTYVDMSEKTPKAVTVTKSQLGQLVDAAYQQLQEVKAANQPVHDAYQKAVDASQPAPGAASQPASAIPIPADKSQWKVGQTYINTAGRKAKWNGTTMEIVP